MVMVIFVAPIENQLATANNGLKLLLKKIHSSTMYMFNVQIVLTIQTMLLQCVYLYIVHWMKHTDIWVENIVFWTKFVYFGKQMANYTHCR